MSQLLSILLKLLPKHQTYIKSAKKQLNSPIYMSVVSLPAFHLNSVKVQAFSSAPYPEPDILVILLVVMTIPTPHPAVGLMFAGTLEWSDANQVYSLSGTPGCGRTLTQKHLMSF